MVYAYRAACLASLGTLHRRTKNCAGRGRHPIVSLLLALDSVFPSPFPRRRFVPRAVGLVHVRDLRNQRIVWVRVGEHGADGEEDYARVSHLARLQICIKLVPLEIVRAGLHWSRRMSKQMLPFELMFG